MTNLLRHGSGLHRLCQGAGMGAVFTRGTLGLSMVHLVQGTGCKLLRIPVQEAGHNNILNVPCQTLCPGVEVVLLHHQYRQSRPVQAR